MKRTSHSHRKRTPLAEFLHWFIGLRWLAGAAVLTLALLDWRVLHWYTGHGAAKVAVGAAVLVYNAILALVLRHATAASQSTARGGNMVLLGLAWLQIILDVVALVLLSLWTGGAHSPLLGLFALHMVFAAMLLPRSMAYGGAAVTMLIMVGALAALGPHWPLARDEKLHLLGWCGTLLATVFVGSQIARSLRRQRRRLIRQKRALLEMDRTLRRQERSMAQHEKMVAMGQMAAGVAHEIANPLASIDSLLQLMQRKPERLTPESLATLRQQADRIARIVHELTTFSRLDDGQRHTLAVNDVVREAVEMLSFDPRMKRVRREESFGADAGAVTVLPQALQQVVVNLVRNALDAMEETPHPVLRVRTAREGDHVVIEVADNGPGIEPKNLKRLFEPFFTTKPVGKGTGLGLSISYSLIERHGGSIGVASRPGQGATFRVKLPVTAKLASVGG
jgi:signal transduction histidine kinase